jgi:hypothetical protein
MQDFQDQLTISLAGKTHYALLAFLKKHGASKDDVSRFVEEAITWRIIDREMAFRHADGEHDVQLFNHQDNEDQVKRMSA